MPSPVPIEDEVWMARCLELAAAYRTALAGAQVHVPVELDGGHVYHLFPIRSRQRAALQSRLCAEGIETLIHYPMTIPQQPAFAATEPAECPSAACAAAEVLSLPLYPGLSVETVRAVAAAVRAAS